MVESVNRSLWGDLKQAGIQLLENGALETSGYLAYTLLVAAFPFIIFLFSCASLFSGDAAAQALVREGLSVMPPQVRDQLWPIIQDVLAKPRPGLLTFGIVAAIWAASAGADAVRDALNRAYDVKETRSWFRRKLGSLLSVLVGSLGGLLAAGAMVVLPSLIKWLGLEVEVPDSLIIVMRVARFALTGAMLTGLFILVYKRLPAPPARKFAAWPGALVATILWLLLASAFSIYLYYFNNYSSTYGSLGGVVILLLFLQFSSLVFLYGAEFNASSAPQPKQMNP